MKRLLVILLLTSLLCGCAATQTPSVSEETKLQIEKEVLPGGVWVQTDYSQYAPQENLESKYTRLSDDFISELQPSDDYGMLYPFIGSYGGDPYYPLLKYGMIDQNGRIVVDAVYNEIEPVQHHYLSSGEQIPMWCLSAYVEADEWAQERCALASFDGSFVTEPIYDYVKAFEDYVLADVAGTYITHVYDRNGKLCLDSSSWALSERFVPNFEDSDLYFRYGGGIISYGDGIFTVRLDDGVYYADWDGNLIAGPFFSGEAFSDGYARVMPDENTYAYIDTKGNKLLGMEFPYAESFQNGYAVATISDEVQALICAADGTVLTFDGYYSSIEDSVLTVWGLNGRDRFYNLKGEPIFEAPDDNSYTIYAGGKFLQCHDTETLTNRQTGKQIQISSIVNVHNDGDRLTLHCYEYRYVGDVYEYKYYVLDENLEILLESEEYLYFENDIMAQRSYYVSSEKDTKLFDLQGGTLELRGTVESIFDGKILCYDDLASYQYDLQGNLLFCYIYPSGNGD